MDCGYFVFNMYCDLIVFCIKDICRKECIDGMFEKKKNILFNFCVYFCVCSYGYLF